MRLTALTGMLLVAWMGVAAAEDTHSRSHRKVLLDTKPAAVKDATATLPVETKPAGVVIVNITEAAVNAAKAANATGNATGNATREGDGWGNSPRDPDYCFASISCRKRKLMQAIAANKVKAAGAEGVKAIVGAVNATGLPTANAANVTGNASGETTLGHGGVPYHGSGTHDSWTVADQVYCSLVGCKKRKSTPVAAATQDNATKAANSTAPAGNATGTGTKEEPLGSGGDGSNGPVARPPHDIPCILDKCLKRKLMQTSAADTAASVANEIKAAGAEGVNATTAAVNATRAAAVGAATTGNATGNATSFRARGGGEGHPHHGGDGWGRGDSPYGPRTPFGV